MHVQMTRRLEGHNWLAHDGARGDALGIHFQGMHLWRPDSSSLLYITRGRSGRNRRNASRCLRLSILGSGRFPRHDAMMVRCVLMGRTAAMWMRMLMKQKQANDIDEKTDAARYDEENWSVDTYEV